MKICFPSINKIFELQDGAVNTLVIENAKLLFDILNDINAQLSGNEGKTVVSIDNKPTDMVKNVELLTQFVPFDVNQKSLVNKACAAIEKRANEEDFYAQTLEIVSGVEKLLLDISFDMIGDIGFSKLNISSIIKASGIEFCNEYEKLAEAVIDYMELVKEYDRDKLFILYNIRSLIDDQEAFLFFDTCIKHNIKIFCIESSIHVKQTNENVYIIDKDLCEISI